MAIKNIAIVLAIVFVAANAVPYSKFGRTCKDIGCLSSEVCVMAEEPCNYGHQRDQCGRYPTCQRSTSGGETCTTKICPSGQYCRTEGGRPTCVNTNAGLAYDSAGVSSVNGEKLPGGQQQPAVPADPYGSRYANGNPYANANAPPAEDVHGNKYNNPPPMNNYPSHASNNGYPPYPISNNNNAGYPPYPSGNNNNHNNGYPAYPSSNNNNGYPPYPSNNRPAGEQYGTNRLPQHNPGWNNIYPGSVYNRKNGVSANGASIVLLVITSLVGSLRIIKA